LKTEIVHRPSFSLLRVELSQGEEITAEAGALVYMSPEIKVRTTTGGGVFSGLLRKLTTGESIFVNTYYTDSRGYLALAPSYPGDIVEIDVNGGLIVADTAYLASTGLELGVRFTGFRGVFMPGGMFWFHLSGIGKAWISTYGGIDVIELKPGERILVDNIHVAAFTEGMQFSLRSFGKLKSMLFGGEYILVEFVGPGRVYVQSRNLPAFAHVLARFMPSK